MSEQGSGRSEDAPDDQGDETGPLTVPDGALPEDLRPSEDNPLAEPADEDVPDDLLKDTSGGGSSDSSSDDQSDDQSDDGSDGSDDDA
jgi:hypothetical protein